MIKRFMVFIFIVLGVAGCVTRVEPDALGAAVRRHTDVGLNHVFYMGSRGEDHFLLHQHAWGSRVYRVSARDILIEPTFPYTRDADEWRLLAERWWPTPVEGQPLEFRELTPPGVRDSGSVRITPVSDAE